MIKRLMPALVLFLIVVMTFPGCGQQSSSAGMAAIPDSLSSSGNLTVLSAAEGNISFMRSGSTTWTVAQVGITLQPGDTIKADDNSWAQITFFEGTIADIEAGTTVRVAELGLTADTGATTIRLKQDIGKTVSRTMKLMDAASTYEIETPAAVAVIRGSEMLVAVTEDGATTVGNQHGTISVISRGVEMRIPEQMQSSVVKGEPPKPSVQGLPFTPSHKDSGQKTGQQSGAGTGQHNNSGNSNPDAVSGPDKGGTAQDKGKSDTAGDKSQADKDKAESAKDKDKDAPADKSQADKDKAESAKDKDKDAPADKSQADNSILQSR